MTKKILGANKLVGKHLNILLLPFLINKISNNKNDGNKNKNHQVKYHFGRLLQSFLGYFWRHFI